MSQRWLQYVNGSLWLASGVLLLLVSLRFLFIAITSTLVVSSGKTTTLRPVDAPDQQLALPALSRAVQVGTPLPSSFLPPQSLPNASAEPAEPPRVRVSLMVNLAPERSGVYVGGVNVGQTPYLGQVTCQVGMPIKIEVMPPKGMPRVFEEPCTGTSIEIRAE